jgi:lipopolysaccharide biosynthesis glycosyltransferase
MELPFLVLASSLKRHLKGDRKVVLHAFHSDPVAHDLAYFVGLNSAMFELRLRPIENRFHGPVAWPSHLTAATLLRLQLPSVLKDIDRVVYLDCDLVVLNDIAFGGMFGFLAHRRSPLRTPRLGRRRVAQIFE